MPPDMAEVVRVDVLGVAAFTVLTRLGDLRVVQGRTCWGDHSSGDGLDREQARAVLRWLGGGRGSRVCGVCLAFSLKDMLATDPEGEGDDYWVARFDQALAGEARGS